MSAHRPNRHLFDAMTAVGVAAALTLVAGSALGQSTDPNDPDFDPVAAGEAAQAELERMMRAAEGGDAGGQGGVTVTGESIPEGFASGGMAIADSAERELDVAVSEYQTVDMKLVDEDLIVVLNTLAEQARVNIIASRDVNATVSANLYGVTFEEALDALLHVNGYAWERRGNFIYVMTRDEWLRREQEARTKESRVIQLNYLNATDAAQFVEPLLSEVGEIVANAAASEFALSEGRPTGAEDFALESTLVVYDYPEHIEEIVGLVESLDTRPSQVLVEATILQTALTEANAFGVDFAIVDDINFIDFFDFGGPLGAPAALSQVFENNVAPVDNEATAVASRPGNFSGPANFRASILAEDVAFFIRALDEVSDTTILSNPKILTLNRQPARVLVGRKLGYLNTTSTEVSTQQTVEFLDTGTQLAFRPFISKDDMIRLELTPRVSEGVIRSATDATGAAVTIPDEITQELTTNVIVPDGSTVVLGGLFKETTELKRSQVPVLGDIPVVGVAFRGHDDETDRQEIIFMITPTIMNDKKMIADGERGVRHVERVRFGSRQGLLPWSRDKQTRNLNVEAERHIRDGEFDKAMANLTRSLQLNPQQADVRRLREEISNEVDYWPSRSILEQILDEDELNVIEPMNEEEEVTLDLTSADDEAADTPTDAETVASDESGDGIATNADPSDDGATSTITTADDPTIADEPLVDEAELFSDPVADSGTADNAFDDPFDDVDPVHSQANAGVNASELAAQPTPSTEPTAANQPVTIDATDAESLQPTADADSPNTPEPAQGTADMTYVDPFAQFVRSDRSARLLRHDPVVAGDDRNVEADDFHDPVLDGTHFPPENETTQLNVAGAPEAPVQSQPQHTNSQRKPFGYVPDPLPGGSFATDERYNVPNHTLKDNVLSRFPGAQRKLDRILAGITTHGTPTFPEAAAGTKEAAAATTGPFEVAPDPTLASPFRFAEGENTPFTLSFPLHNSLSELIRAQEGAERAGDIEPFNPLENLSPASPDQPTLTSVEVDADGE